MAPPIVENDLVSDDHRKAEALNSYFCSQTEINITDKYLQLVREYKSSYNSTQHTFQFSTITPRDVLKTINGLDSSKATGSDGVPAKLINMSAACIAEPLSRIVNKSVQKGRYPTQWKKATVKPILKEKGSPSEAASYRPISLLPCLSKIFEKLMFAQIYKHIHSHSLLTKIKVVIALVTTQSSNLLI